MSTVEPLLPHQADEEVLGVRNRCELDLHPGGRAIGLEEFCQSELHPGNRLQRHDWLVERDDTGHPRGLAFVERFFLAQNRHIAECELHVDPEHRRIGVGERLLGSVLDLIEADARTSLIGWGPTTPSCRGFWTSMGLGQKYIDRVSRVDLTQTDAALMRSWIDAAAERAAGYKLVFWRGACPEERRAEFAATETALNDAPIDDLELSDWHFDATYVAERDATWLESGSEPWVLLAIASATRAVAGVTAFLINLHAPAHSEQWTTVVLPEHRGKGLGRLMKATLFERLRSERPEVRYLETWNAESNKAMLAINVAMGFLPRREYAAWQADTKMIRKRLTRG